MIIYKRFLIFFNIHLLTFCFIEKSKYIKDITSSKHLEIELNKNVKLSGMMLVYSSRCHHCKEFSKTYIKLAETYNNQLFFYSMSKNLLMYMDIQQFIFIKMEIFQKIKEVDHLNLYLKL